MSAWCEKREETSGGNTCPQQPLPLLPIHSSHFFASQMLSSPRCAAGGGQGRPAFTFPARPGGRRPPRPRPPPRQPGGSEEEETAAEARAPSSTPHGDTPLPSLPAPPQGGNASGRPATPALPARQLLAFERDGYTIVRGLLDPGFVTQALGPAVAASADAGALQALRQRLRVVAPAVDAAALATPAAAEAAFRAAAGGEAPGFRQHFNLHRSCPAAAAAAAALAAVASQLLAAGPGQGTRLLSTCAFVKRPGDGPTQWHADARMSPVDGRGVTAWVPLRGVAPGGSARDSGLTWAAGSHRDAHLLFFYRFWEGEAVDLSGRGYALAPAPALAPGDVAFHDAWTLHAAGGQPAGMPGRAALSAQFFLDGATLLPPPPPSGGRKGGGGGKRPGGGGGGGNSNKGRAACAPARGGARDDEDDEAYSGWLADAWEAGGGGAVIEHPMVPVVHVAGGGGGGGARRRR